MEKYGESKNITLLISESKKPVKAYSFLLKLPVRAQEFALLAGPKWESFIRDDSRLQGITLTASAAKFLAEAFQGNAWGLATELQKIGTFKKNIDRSDLDELGLAAAPNYWGLLNGVKGYDMRVRLASLETVFATGDPAPKLFNILASQWKEKTEPCAKYDIAIKSGKIEYEEALVDLIIG